MALKRERKSYGWKKGIWDVLFGVSIAGSIYIPFCRSPEMTEAQLFLNYWWFYVPVLGIVAAWSVFRRR